MDKETREITVTWKILNLLELCHLGVILRDSYSIWIGLSIASEDLTMEMQFFLFLSVHLLQIIS